MFVFASSLPELAQSAITAAILGAVWGAIQLAKWLISERGKNDQTPPSAPATTGKFDRLVTADECKDNHGQTADQLQRGSERMAAQERALNAVKLEVREGFANMRAEVREGVANLRTAIHQGIQRHEEGPLHRGRND